MATISSPAGSAVKKHEPQTRSCQKCNQRKTRCSKTIPCTSCVKLGMECVFPPPGRAPRRKKRALKAELVSRVQDLELQLQRANRRRSNIDSNNEETLRSRSSASPDLLSRLPLNTDDSDLSPESEEPFTGRTGFAETTFFLVRCEFNMRYRQLMHASRPKLSPNQVTIEDTTAALSELNTFIENQWLRFCDRTIPIQWVAATVTRVALARLWLTAHLSLERTGELSTEVWQQRREVLFQTAIEILEFAHLLESSEETRQWSWMFQMYRQIGRAHV